MIAKTIGLDYKKVAENTTKVQELQGELHRAINGLPGNIRQEVQVQLGVDIKKMVQDWTNTQKLVESLGTDVLSIKVIITSEM